VINPSDSNIFSLASVGSYLDALSSITHEMTLKERSNLIFLDRCLHEQWGLGQNVLLNWCPTESGIDLLVVPHYSVAGYASESARPLSDGGGNRNGRLSEEFFQALLAGQRRLDSAQFAKVARLLGVGATALPLRDSVVANEAQQRIIEKMVKRYSISYVPDRAVALFDIVGFSLLSPFEQMTQLNSLSYSMNSAQSKLMSKRIGIDFARSTAGDGFYVWNRDLTLDANVNLYQFMQLVLADNAIARRKAQHNVVPELRACFHVGSSYEFHQSEGLNPTLYNYIVGDVTIDLARMIDHALPGQILVGEFRARMPTVDKPPGEFETLDAIDFVLRATRSLAQLEGIMLSGEYVDSIKCYLTGSRLENGEFSVRRMIIDDKHGISRNVYNAKANIYRQNAQPILLGIEDRILSNLHSSIQRSEHVVRPLQV